MRREGRVEVKVVGFIYLLGWYRGAALPDLLQGFRGGKKEVA